MISSGHVCMCNKPKRLKILKHRGPPPPSSFYASPISQSLSSRSKIYIAWGRWCHTLRRITLHLWMICFHSILFFFTANDWWNSPFRWLSCLCMYDDIKLDSTRSLCVLRLLYFVSIKRMWTIRIENDKMVMQISCNLQQHYFKEIQQL